MENKLFWKVYYEHLEKAVSYAGKTLSYKRLNNDGDKAKAAC